MKIESTDMQERAQQLWRELDGLDWSSHEQAIVGILRDALEEVHNESRPTHGRSEVGQSPRASTATEGVDRVAEYREQFQTVLGQADYNPSCTKLHYVFHPVSKFEVGEQVLVTIERLPRTMKTKELNLGGYYWCRPMNELVRLVTIDKSGYKRHSTVRLVVESVQTKLRRILRSPSLLLESDKKGRVKKGWDEL